MNAAAAAPLRHRRFAGWDYAKGASLFVTIATEPRRAVLGRVVGDKVALSALGAIVREAIDAIPRLDIGDYWKGVGNTALLDPALNIASLRVSRKVRDIPAVVARIESAVSKGWVILSGFISPGEKAVLEMLSRRADARFIRILPSCIPNARYKPDSILVEPFNDNRFLEIAEGNDEVSFDRNACLHLNDEIIEIATSTSGLALYFTEHGLKVLKRSQNPTPAHQ